MSSSADLFVVCKQCGSEVSPYITECPYCGHRLRRRAPKLPREKNLSAGARRPHRQAPLLGRLRRGEIPGIRADAPPYATIALVAVTCAAWVLLRGAYVNLGDTVIAGPLQGDWWRLFTTQFSYFSGFSSGVYMLTTLVGIGVFGWLLERRHGPLVVLALCLGAGASGALAAVALYPEPLVSGGNGAALGLLAAWAVPDLLALRTRDYYDGDLLGTAAIVAVLLAMPLARVEASWLVGVVGGCFGLLFGFGLHRLRSSA